MHALIALQANMALPLEKILKKRHARITLVLVPLDITVPKILAQLQHLVRLENLEISQVVEIQMLLAHTAVMLVNTVCKERQIKYRLA